MQTRSALQLQNKLGSTQVNDSHPALSWSFHDLSRLLSDHVLFWRLLTASLVLVLFVSMPRNITGLHGGILSWTQIQPQAAVNLQWDGLRSAASGILHVFSERFRVKHTEALHSLLCRVKLELPQINRTSHHVGAGDAARTAIEEVIPSNYMPRYAPVCPGMPRDAPVQNLCR